MASRLSRRKLAAYAAKRLIEGDEAILDQVAALLISERRERESSILARDIEDQLLKNGQMVLTVESARTINNSLRSQVEQLFPRLEVHIREVVRPELIGGLRIITPTQEFDATVASKLKTLRAMKV